MFGNCEGGCLILALFIKNSVKREKLVSKEIFDNFFYFKVFCSFQSKYLIK